MRRAECEIIMHSMPLASIIKMDIGEMPLSLGSQTDSQTNQQ